MGTRTGIQTPLGSLAAHRSRSTNPLMYTKFGRESFAVQHNLTSHPLLTIDRLAQGSADSLPADQAEFVAHDMPDLLPGGGEQDER